ncbi:MAG: alkaline phosphatase family protein [Betaproteobacteria bacterium]|nr:alkaline phosphatase family protein [Betaproteobacteria bacterium]
MVRPDYQGGSLINLMSSLLAAYGAEGSGYPLLRNLPLERLERAKAVVLLVVDGLGYEYLARRHAGSRLARSLHGRITSTFPSTTATAITTFLTGLAPQQHALTGWNTYFKEIGCIATVLPFRPRFGGSSLKASGIQPQALFGHTPVFDRLPVTSYVVSPEKIVHSDFNVAYSGRAIRLGYRDAEGMFARIGEVIRQNAARKYIYAYYSDIDGAAHEHGIDSPAVARLFEGLDAAFARFVAAIAGTGTLVIVTADHGHIESGPGKLLDLADHPVLANTLVMPLCGERRVAYCYVRPQARADFERYVETALAPYARAFKSEELVAEAYYGLGAPHPRLRERIGDYTLIMKRDYAIQDRLLGETPHMQMGVHGGVSEAEMYVPLAVVEC